MAETDAFVGGGWRSTRRKRCLNCDFLRALARFGTVPVASPSDMCMYISQGRVEGPGAGRAAARSPLLSAGDLSKTSGMGALRHRENRRLYSLSILQGRKAAGEGLEDDDLTKPSPVTVLLQLVVG